MTPRLLQQARYHTKKEPLSRMTPLSRPILLLSAVYSTRMIFDIRIEAESFRR